jgi:hypothetical protein
MRAILSFLLSLFLLFLTSSQIIHSTEVSKSPEVPFEISEFYSDYNFICSFSTRPERDRLASYFNQEKPPIHLKSPRLIKILKLMKKLSSQVKKANPQMRVRPHRARSSSNIFQSELIEVKNVRLFGKKASVEVVAYVLGPNLVFIEQYEKNEGDENKIPSEMELIDSLKKTAAPRKEFHQWIHQGHRWVKLDVNLVFLKGK